MSVLRVILALIRNILADRAELVTENLALRQPRTEDIVASGREPFWTIT